MNIQIQSVKFDADQKLVDFVENKMSKLGKFSDKIVAADMILKIDKDNDRGNKTATVELWMAGDDLVAKTRAHTFEEAVDKAIEDLKSQIARRKEKYNG